MSLHNPQAILSQLQNHSYHNAQEKIELIDKLKEIGQATPENLVWMLISEDKNYRDFSYAIFSKNKNQDVMGIILKEMSGKGDETIEKYSLVLANLSPGGLENFLQTKIKRGTPKDKIVVLKILKNMGNIESYIPLYNTTLRDPSEEIRLLSVQILCRHIEKNEIFSMLCPLLMDKSENIRQKIIAQLSRVKNLKIITIIFEIMGRETKDNQEILISVLKEIAKRRQLDIVDLILPALMDSNGDVRKAAALFFASLPDLYDSTIHLLMQMRKLSFDIKKKIFKSFKHIEKQITEVVVSLLHNEDFNHRIDALIISMNLEDERIPDGIDSILKQNFDWWIKLLGIEILAKYKSPKTIAILEQHEDDFLLEWAVVAAYGDLQCEEKLPYLEKHLNNSSKDIRICALRSIHRIGTETAMKVIQNIATPQCDNYLHAELKLIHQENSLPFAIPDLEKSNDKEYLREMMDQMGLKLESGPVEVKDDDIEQSIVLDINTLNGIGASLHQQNTPPQQYHNNSYENQEQQYHNNSYENQEQHHNSYEQQQQYHNDSYQNQEQHHNSYEQQQQHHNDSYRYESNNDQYTEQHTNQYSDYEQNFIANEMLPNANLQAPTNSQHEETISIPDEIPVNSHQTPTSSQHQDTISIPDDVPVNNQNSEHSNVEDTDSPGKKTKAEMLHNFRSRFHRITTKMTNPEQDQSPQSNESPSFKVSQNNKPIPQNQSPSPIRVSQQAPAPTSQPFTFKASDTQNNSFNLAAQSQQAEEKKKSHIPDIFSKRKTAPKSEKKSPFNLGSKANLQFNIQRKKEEEET